MSRASNADIRNLGKLARQAKKGTTPAQLFLSGRKSGLAWAHRVLNRNLADDVQYPETADDAQLRSWLRGFGAGVTAAVMEDMADTRIDWSRVPDEIRYGRQS